MIEQPRLENAEPEPRNADGERPSIFSDVVLSSLVTAVLVALAAGLLTGFGTIAAIVTMAFGLHKGISAFVYGVPLAVALYGLVRRRAGFVIGPAVLAVVSFAAYATVRSKDAMAVEAFSVADLHPASRRHNLLAIEGESSGCDDICILILATSDYMIAQTSSQRRPDQAEPSSSAAQNRRRSAATRTHRWRIFKRGEGDTCLSKERGQTRFRFLSAGFRDMCLIQSSAADIGDALVYRGSHVSNTTPWPELPLRFNGQVREIVERIDGEERLLARRLVGTLNPPVPPLLVAGGKVEQIDRGARIDLTGFLASALGISVDELKAARRFDPAPVFDELESLFDQPALATQARSTWLTIAQSQVQDHPEVVLARIRHLIASEDFERFRFGLSALRSLPAAVQRSEAPRVLEIVRRVLESHDVTRLSFGLSALRNLPVADQLSQAPRVTELAFSPLADQQDSPLVRPLISNLNWHHDPFPVDVRARASARFTGEVLTLGQRQIMFVIMVRGNVSTRREAVDALFSLSGPAFEQAVQAIGKGESDVWARNVPTRWTSEEADRLIARIPDIPNSRLKAYLDTFRFISLGRRTDQIAAIVEHLRSRLQAAESAPERDEAQITQLKLLIEIVPKQ